MWWWKYCCVCEFVTLGVTEEVRKPTSELRQGTHPFTYTNRTEKELDFHVLRMFVPCFSILKKDKRGRGSEWFSFCSYFCFTPITPIIRTHSSSALVRLVSAFFPPISYTPLILIQVTVTGSSFYLYRRHVTDREVKHLHSDDKQGRQGKCGNKSRQPSVRRNTFLISRDVNSQVSRSMMLA